MIQTYLILFCITLMPFSTFSQDLAKFDAKLSAKIAEQILNLSQKLTEQILAKGNEKFLVLSPVSLATALQLCLLGAEGETFDELKDILGYNNESLAQVHKEFANLLNDFLTGKQDPTRPRQKPKWKEDFSDIFKKMLEKLKPEDYQNEISFANGVFLHTDIKVNPDYEKAVKFVFKSVYKPINYSIPINSSNYINDWVSIQTNGKIKRLIAGQLGSNTKLIMANALYFNAKWMYSCEKEENVNFYPNGHKNSPVKVNMIKFDNEFPYYDLQDTCNVRAMGFPYQKNISTLYIFLPLDSDREKVEKAQKCLTAANMDKIIDQMNRVEAKAWLPEFHLKSGSNFKIDLKKMGLVTLFKGNKSDLSLITKGDISGFDKGNLNDGQASLINLDKMRGMKRNNDLDPNLYVDDIVHRVDLQVSEEGTEGAAATLVSGPQFLKVIQHIKLKEEFKVDSPFVFLLKHDLTKVSLFYGVVFEPIKSE